MSTPNSDIVLCNNVPLDNKYEHTIDFDSANAQATYFNALASFSLNDYTYIKATDSVKVVGGLETYIYVTYAFYSNMGGKRVYCFVVDKKYISDNCTEIFFQIDVMQTYQFNYSLSYCMVDREHMNRWTAVNAPVLNLVDENLDYGNDYVQASQIGYTANNTWDWYLVCATEPLGDDTIRYSTVQGVPSPLCYYLVPHNRALTTPTVVNFTAESSTHRIIDGNLFYLLATDAKIISVSYIPYMPFAYSVVLSGGEYTITCTDATNKAMSHGDYSADYELIAVNTLSKAHLLKALGTHTKYSDITTMPSSFGTTKTRSYNYESKLLFYPYLYYLLSDNQSTPALYKNELLPSSVVMQCVQSLSSQPKVKYYIDDYKGDSAGKHTTVINNSVNDLGLSTDAYINYMQNNKASANSGIALSLAGGAVALGVGAVTGGVGLALGAGVAMSAFSTIASEFAKRKDLSNMPDNARALGNNIQFDLVDDNRSLILYRFEITDEYKQMLGDFFAMYGYKCNKLKVPSLRTRLRYNFIKTLQCNIARVSSSGVPSPHIEKLKEIYNAGVTIWHHRASYNVAVFDYQYDNVEMTLI